MSVKRKTGEVFDAILNSPPKIQPDAIQNQDGSWSWPTPRGNANLKFMENKSLGNLNSKYTDNEASWNVPMRVVPSGEESEVIITVEKPENLSMEIFDERMKEIGMVFADLKRIIESS